MSRLDEAVALLRRMCDGEAMLQAIDERNWGVFNDLCRPYNLAKDGPADAVAERFMEGAVHEALSFLATADAAPETDDSLTGTADDFGPLSHFTADELYAAYRRVTAAPETDAVGALVEALHKINNFYTYGKDKDEVISRLREFAQGAIDKWDRALQTTEEGR